MDPRPRDWPARSLTLGQSVTGFLDFVNTTALNKIAGLTEAEARQTPISTSPALSPLGLLKHLTAVQRQHIQIHIGGADLPALWDPEDHDAEFRLQVGDTIASVVAAFDAECDLSRQTLTGLDLETRVVAYGEANRAGRLLVDVLQECARHLGHLDVVRELIDGDRGE
jgi:uncharacterized damage-inducible protein DinB